MIFSVLQFTVAPIGSVTDLFSLILQVNLSLFSYLYFCSKFLIQLLFGLCDFLLIYRGAFLMMIWKTWTQSQRRKKRDRYVKNLLHTRSMSHNSIELLHYPVGQLELIMMTHHPNLLPFSKS